MKIRNITVMVLILLLAAGALACGGGGSDPVNPNAQQNPGSGTTLTGRILDREGDPAGAPFATVKLTVVNGGTIAPSLQPAATGANAGVFQFVGLPVGIPMVLEIDLFQVAIGRNLGYIQQLTLSGGGTFNLGDIVLENDYLDNGWNAYITRDYSLAIINFNRSIEDRFIQADGLTYSSSAYNGLGWTYAKRGKDYQTGLWYIDNNGFWVDSMNSYEWDQALINFQRAISNPRDADAWVGMAGTYVTLLGMQNKDPVLIGTEIPFYSFVSFYYDEAEEALLKGLSADPNYNCSHDVINADDIQAMLLYLDWIQGSAINLEEVSTLAASGNVNQGSLQLLEVLPDLVQYNPYPQL